jgi:transposase
MQAPCTAEQRRARFCAIYDLYLDGLSLREISLKVGVSHERVRQILRKSSTEEEYKIIKAAADRRRSRTWQTREAINLLNAGNSCSKVANILGISVSSIKRLSAQYNKSKKQTP